MNISKIIIEIQKLHKNKISYDMIVQLDINIQAKRLINEIKKVDLFKVVWDINDTGKPHYYLTPKEKLNYKFGDISIPLGANCTFIGLTDTIQCTNENIFDILSEFKIQISEKSYKYILEKAKKELKFAEKIIDYLEFPKNPCNEITLNLCNEIVIE